MITVRGTILFTKQHMYTVIFTNTRFNYKKKLKTHTHTVKRWRITYYWVPVNSIKARLYQQINSNSTLLCRIYSWGKWTRLPSSRPKRECILIKNSDSRFYKNEIRLTNDWLLRTTFAMPTHCVCVYDTELRATLPNLRNCCQTLIVCRNEFWVK